MKRKYFIIVITLLTQQFAFGQEVADKFYYTNINKAELFILDSNYAQSLLYYDSAFLVKKNPFAKDRYNAAVCATLLNRNEKCYNELKFVLDKGYGILNIKSQKVFDAFFKTKYGKKLIDYNGLNRRTYNPYLRNTIDSLLDADQLFRKKEGKYVVYMDTIKKMDESNVKMLNKLISQYGFPSEELVGVPDSSFMPKSFYIIIIHQGNGSPSRVFDYTDMLKKALEDGKIETHVAAELIDKSSGNFVYGSDLCGITKIVLDSVSSFEFDRSNLHDNYDDVKWGYIKLSPVMEIKINNRRTEIGLETINEARAKSIFIMKDTRFALSTVSSNSVYVYIHQTDYDEAMKNLIIIQ